MQDYEAVLDTDGVSVRTILLCRASSHFGGIETQLTHIAGAYRDAGNLNPVLVTDSLTSPLARTFSGLALHVAACPSLRHSVPDAVIGLRAIARQYDAPLIETHGFREAIIGALARIAQRTVRHIARLHTYIDSSFLPEWRKRQYHYLSWATTRGVDRYIPITKAVERELVERTKISAERVIVVPDGVPRLGPPDEPCMSIAPLAPRVAMVANLVPHKGHDVLIRALAELRRRRLIVRARLIGGEAYTPNTKVASSSSLRTLARAAGVDEQLEFYGFTRNVHAALQGFAVVVLPSDSEGLPNSLLEAMSTRKLVIASRVGGVPQIIAHGRDGLLHGFQDHVGMADLLQRVFTTPALDWEDMRDRAAAAWDSKFSLDATVPQLIAIVQELMASSAAQQANVAFRP